MYFDHLGIVVPTLADGRAHLTGLFDITAWTDEFCDPFNQEFVQFGRDGSGICYEAIAPLGETSPVLSALAKADRILNHVAYRVATLDVEATRLAKLECVPVGLPKPAVAYGNARIQFFVTPLRFLVELIEAAAFQHVYVGKG